MTSLAAPLSQLSAAAATARAAARVSLCVGRTFSAHSRLFRREPHEVVDAAEKKLVLSQSDIFDEVGRLQKARDKSAFMKSLQIYEQKQSVHRRAHVEFIHAAMSKMEEFGVQKDVEVYKALFNIFPKKVMVPVNVWQSEMMHYPKQQDCALDILQKMENYGVVPDDKTGDLIVSIFGIRSHVMRKYQRMMYWMPKFKHMNPYPVPSTLPSDPAELAVLALKRMAVDPENKVTLFNIADAGLAAVDGGSGSGGPEPRRFVASAQSPEQAALLAEQPASAPLYVDGPHLVWLRDKSVKCFVLQTEGHRSPYDGGAAAAAVQDSSRPAASTDDSWLDTLDSSLTSDRAAQKQKQQAAAVTRSSLHHQPGGIVLAMCIPWAAHKDAVLAWITMLQKDNPHIGRLAVVLKLRSSSDGGGSAPCEELLHQRLLDSEASPQGQQ